MNSNYFEVTYRGLTAEVEPAHGTNRWEIRLSTEGDWNTLDFNPGDACVKRIGYFPKDNIDAARAAAVEFLKRQHPGELAAAYRQLERINKRIAELRADEPPVVFNPGWPAEQAVPNSLNYGV